MIWTVALLVPSITGVWLAPKAWYGWLISALSEGLWIAYSVVTHDVPLLLMSFVWLGVHARNTWVTMRAWKPYGISKVPGRDV
jgi:hypothetical protein